MVQVIEGDCLEVLATLDASSVDCIITSPPYNLDIKYKTYKDQRSDYLPWLNSVFEALQRVLKPGGHFFLQMGGTASNPLIPHQVLAEALPYFKLQNQIIWAKHIAVGKNSFGHFKLLNSDKYLTHIHEFIFHLTNDGAQPVDKLAIGVPFKDTSNIHRFGHTENKRCRGNIWHIPYDTVNSSLGKFHHPAAFPIELPRMCLKFSGLPEGSMVLDPFAGSGSTLVACEELGFSGVGIELDPGYANTARARVGERSLDWLP